VVNILLIFLILIQTKNGQSISGRLEAETENSITLRTAFGTEESILRTNITTLSNSGLSLMPEGFEKSMTKDELRNLIAFLKK
jgi:putative heme-binding domain-containing protein